MFGRKIKMLKRVLNCSQLALASILGVTQTTISNWENNYQVPSQLRLQDLQKLCDENEIKIKFID